MEASQNLSAATNPQSITAKSALYIDNFPKDDVRRDVLTESCEESLRFETPDVFAVCSLYDMGIKGNILHGARRSDIRLPGLSCN